MKVYICQRCGSKYDFATKNAGRQCEHCGAYLFYHGEEISAWGENPHLKDYDNASYTP